MPTRRDETGVRLEAVVKAPSLSSAPVVGTASWLGRLLLDVPDVPAAPKHGPIGQLGIAGAPPATLEGMTARWSDPHRLPVPPTGYVRAVNSAAAR